jgi:hypothetical protein
MLELALAYLFAAGTTVAVVYLAKQNRKQGWQRPAPKWFDVALENQASAPPTSLLDGSESGELLPQLLQLNRSLAAPGTPIQPEVESGVESPKTPEPISSLRV